MNMPPIVSPQEWEAARERCWSREGAYPRPRRARRRPPADAAHGGGEGLPLRRPGRQGEPARPVRGAPAADRLPLLLRAWRRRAGPSEAAGAARSSPTRSPTSRISTPATRRSRSSRARRSRTSSAGRRGWAGRCRGTRSRTTSTPTSASTSGTAPTRSSATASGSSAPTSSTTAATRRWASTWSYLDLTALGRQEEWEDSPEGYPQTPPYQWWNLHDEYPAAA